MLHHHQRPQCVHLKTLPRPLHVHLPQVPLRHPRRRLVQQPRAVDHEVHAAAAHLPRGRGRGGDGGLGGHVHGEDGETVRRELPESVERAGGRRVPTGRDDFSFELRQQPLHNCQPDPPPPETPMFKDQPPAILAPPPPRPRGRRARERADRRRMREMERRYAVMLRVNAALREIIERRSREEAAAGGWGVEEGKGSDCSDEGEAAR
mmetsp:Transcript_8161/g.21423  ORF Transcript_8161/g.21423 Transcript_8161/m.21423 type:complete len:207 (+) Transcript_8161:2182-2802(+)